MPLPLPPLLPTGRLSGEPQPRLNVGELRIRPWEASDAISIVMAYRDTAIQQWHVRTVTLDEATTMIETTHLEWQAESRIDWAVADANDHVLGRVALNHVDRYEGAAEFAYWTLPAARGRGSAVRSVSAVSSWAFGIGFHRLTLRHSVRNEASCRVAQKAGFDYEGTQRQEGRHADGWHDMHLHARLAADRSSAQLA